MNIYLRKILKHDITHQISVTKEILNGFFGVFEEKESTKMRGKLSGFTGTVTFLLSTDPRFGGEIKQIINNEGGMDEDDILLFVKSKDGYVLEIIKTTDERHDTFINIMQEERHLIINIDDADLLEEPIKKYDTSIIVDKVPDNLSIEDLGLIFKEMYDSAPGNKGAGIHIFGIKYGKLINKNGYSASQIVKASTLCQDYAAVLSRALAAYDAIKDNVYGVAFAKKIEYTPAEFNYETTAGKGTNLIFYGTPGCGKSYHIDHKILGKDKTTKEYIGEYRKENIIRTTFYQDYSNTDFVGQILPKIVKGQKGEKDTVEYIFNPGPFTLALIRAIKNPTEKVALVVEEINRGNAPAIFGDIFQLLDRDDETCISEYGIVNVGMIDYLNSLKLKAEGESEEYTFTEIKIPGNMDIFATMNTSDQNVYTLDTAFVRRWGKEKIKNSFAECTFKDLPIPGMKEYTWEEFVNAINNCISSHLEDLQVNEDKQIGAYFVKSSLLKRGDAEKFAYKVFDYLWSDVAKLDHGVIFNPYDTLEKLVEDFKTKGVGVFKSGIFVDKHTAVTQAVAQAQEDDDNE